MLGKGSYPQLKEFQNISDFVAMENLKPHSALQSNLFSKYLSLIGQFHYKVWLITMIILYVK